MEVKGKILAKKGDNKAFKLDDGNWYNLNDVVIPYLEKMNKGDEVVVTFEKKGVSRYVSKLVSATAAKAEPTKLETPAEFKCEDCGATLKDGKYKKCFPCNKKNPTKAKSNFTPSGGDGIRYGSPEDIAGKEMGCALGAAATVAGGCAFTDPETAKQYTLILAEAFLDWMRAKK
jgi:hypothetical protein